MLMVAARGIWVNRNGSVFVVVRGVTLRRTSAARVQIHRHVSAVSETSDAKKSNPLMHKPGSGDHSQNNNWLRPASPTQFLQRRSNNGTFSHACFTFRGKKNADVAQTQ